MLKQSLKDAARALSLANLFFMGAWIPILDGSHNWPNRFKDLAANTIVALILDVLLLAAVFFSVITIVRRSGNKLVMQISRWAFIFALLGISSVAFLSQFPDFSLYRFATRRINYFNITELRVLGGITVLFSSLLTMGRYRWIIAVGSILAIGLLVLSELQVVALVAAIITTFIFIRWHTRIVSAAAGVALIFFPLFLLTFFQSISILGRFASVPNAAFVVQGSQTKARVVWIIFDELDYSLSFARRPSTLEMPEFDRLRDQSFHAANAYPPADYTLLSMPALITGRFVTKANPIHPSEVMLNFEGETEAVRWSSQPSLFSRSRELGVNTGLIGWYHPYQRIIGTSLTFSYVPDTRGPSLPEGMLAHLQEPLKTTPFVGFVNKLEEMKSKWEREKYLALYIDLMSEAQKASTSPDLELILIHYPVPHPPGIYNRTEGRFALEGESSYLDGLALADRTLGDLRRSMEEAGLWDSSVVLVSSDHWWRPHIWQGTIGWSPLDDEFVVAKEEIDHRVPFLMKAPGQVSPLAYNAPFNTVLTHDLILSILRGEVRDPVGIGRWIDQHRSIAESPYSYQALKQ